MAAARTAIALPLRPSSKPNPGPSNSPGPSPNPNPNPIKPQTRDGSGANGTEETAASSLEAADDLSNVWLGPTFGEWYVRSPFPMA